MVAELVKNICVLLIKLIVFYFVEASLDIRSNAASCHHGQVFTIKRENNKHFLKVPATPIGSGSTLERV